MIDETVRPARARQGLFEDEHDDFRESARAFLAGEALPRLPQWRNAGRIEPALFESAGRLGFLGMAAPEACGGLGLVDPRFALVLVEEAMRAGLTGLGLALSAHTAVVTPALACHGPDRYHQWLSGLAAGEVRCALVDGAGLAVPGSCARLTIDGLSRYVPAGVSAELLLVTLPQVPALALLTASSSGISIACAPASLGILEGGLGDVGFTQVVVDGDAILARTSAAVDSVRRDHLVSLAAGAVAAGERALALTIEYVRDRKAFGQPIGHFENSVQVLGRARVQLDAASALSDACAADHTSGTASITKAAAAKAFACDVLADTVDVGLQLHGGYGYVMEYPIAHAYGDARFWRLHGGTTEELRAVVARAAGVGL